MRYPGKRSGRPVLVSVQDLAVFPDFIPHRWPSFAHPPGEARSSVRSCHLVRIPDHICRMDQILDGIQPRLRQYRRICAVPPGRRSCPGPGLLPERSGSPAADHDQIKFLHSFSPQVKSGLSASSSPAASPGSGPDQRAGPSACRPPPLIVSIWLTMPRSAEPAQTVRSFVDPAFFRRKASWL